MQKSSASTKVTQGSTGASFYEFKKTFWEHAQNPLAKITNLDVARKFVNYLACHRNKHVVAGVLLRRGVQARIKNVVEICMEKEDIDDIVQKMLSTFLHPPFWQHERWQHFLGTCLVPTFLNSHCPAPSQEHFAAFLSELAIFAKGDMKDVVLDAARDLVDRNAALASFVRLGPFGKHDTTKAGEGSKKEHESKLLGFRKVPTIPAVDEINEKRFDFLSPRGFYQARTVDHYLGFLFHALRGQTTSRLKISLRDPRESWTQLRYEPCLSAQYERSACVSFLLPQEAGPVSQCVQEEDRLDRYRFCYKGALACICKAPGRGRGDRLVVEPLQFVVLVHTSHWEFHGDRLHAMAMFRGDRDLSDFRHMAETDKTLAIAPLVQHFAIRDRVLLTLQSLVHIPLFWEIALLGPSPRMSYPSQLLPLAGRGSERVHAEHILDKFEASSSEVSYDKIQLAALRYALTTRLALINGEPGTGKTFLCASLARAVSDNTELGVLLLSADCRRLERFLQGKRLRKFPDLPHMESLSMIDRASFHSQNPTHRPHVRTLSTSRVMGRCVLGDSEAPFLALVDDAEDISEPELIAALPGTTKHLVLFGNYRKAKQNKERKDIPLDEGGNGGVSTQNRSLFVRMMNEHPTLNPAYLDFQYRMRPEISRLSRETDNLTPFDHPYVLRYPPLCGSKSNVTFVSHEETEGSGNSPNNAFEAAFCAELTRLLLLQGHTPNQVALVTPYSSQLLLIVKEVTMRIDSARMSIHAGGLESLSHGDLKEIEKLCLEPHTQRRMPMPCKTETHAMLTSRQDWRDQRIRLAVLDGVKGEESDVVIFSTVHCNASGSIGSLANEQVLKLLLSRARRGLIIIGNDTTLRKSGNERLISLLDKLEQAGSIYSGYPSVCARHDQDIHVLRDLDDFRSMRPDGGCLLKCSQRLNCGHACQFRCHPLSHDFVLCQQRCRRVPGECRFQHPCPKLCKDECGRCETLVEKSLPCGHVVQVKCHLYANDLVLQGHCCKELVTIQSFPACSHKNVQVPCHTAANGSPKCIRPCGISLQCHRGSLCMKRCGHRGTHGGCAETCNKPLCCGHKCIQRCHHGEPCEPCQQLCRAQCDHSVCSLQCRDTCAPCLEPCTLSCKHKGGCNLICSAPCTRELCNERCDQNLQCGHRCPSVCGETCPASKFCQICGTEGRLARQLDATSNVEYRDAHVDRDPIIVLRCNHWFALSVLDRYMGLVPDSGETARHASNLRADCAPANPVPLSGEFSFVKKCPGENCENLLSEVRRYARLNKLAELRFQERKHMHFIRLEVERLRPVNFAEKVASLVKFAEQAKDSPMSRVSRMAPSALMSKHPPRLNFSAIIVLQELAACYTRQAANSIRPRQEWLKDYETGQGYLDQAMQLCEKDESHALLARLLIQKMRLLVDVFRSHYESSYETKLADLFRRVRSACSGQPKGYLLVRAAEEICNSPGTLQYQMDCSIQALQNVNAANYHWRECPRGHPYFADDNRVTGKDLFCYQCGLKARLGENAEFQLPSWLQTCRLQ